MTIYPELGAEGRIQRFVGTTLDVTETRQAEATLRRINIELEQRVEARTRELTELNQSLESFVYTVSHDLKAPLRGIEGYGRLLLEEHAQQLDAEGRLFAERIQEGTLRMGQLIDDLLAYARMERRAISVQDVELASVLGQVIEDARTDLERGGVVLELEVPQAPLGVRVDREGLMLALRNLLANAIKFSAASQPPRVRIAVRRLGPEASAAIELRLSDNGVGFDMAYHDRIFEIFQRLHRMEDYPGTGIGLALVRKAMQRMGGTVRAESRPGEGATFVLTLPAVVFRQEPGAA